MARVPSDEYLHRLVEVESLQDYLEAHLGPADEVAVELHGEGHSNETVYIAWGDRDLVLRRPPLGETAETAHDVLREYQVISALQRTDVPVPPTVLACDDDSVIGSDFYVMDRIGGEVLRLDEPKRFAAAAHRRRIGEELVDTLACLHCVDYERAGLGDFGRPEGYTDRQVARWTRQIAWATEVTADQRAIPRLDEIGTWLAANTPDNHPYALVHGDYKLDNVMFAPGTPPQLVSVFDWEMSTLGDPCADLGWMLAFWHDPADPPPAIPDLQPRFTAADGYLRRSALVERYEDRTGFAFEHDRFYRVLAHYKLAALGEMFYRRYLEGNSDDPLYPAMEAYVPAVAASAIRIVHGA